MASFNKFNQFAADIAQKVHSLKTSSDTLKVVLTNTAPTSANAVLADITQIANANGYTTGGTATTVTAASQSSGTFKLVCSDVTFTASGGSVGPFRYAVLYNDTPTSPTDPLIGWWDYGSAVTLADGEPFVVDFDATNGVLQLT